MIETWSVQIPALSGALERLAYCYLPDSYEEGEKRYPVLYMFDGHNVFFDDHATYGKSWGMKEYLERGGKELIVVAVASHPDGVQRLSEYSPYDLEIPGLGALEGRGEVYMQWLTEILKPYIDNRFRTLPDREYTYIAGSSMGGLMSLYGAVKYPQLFCGAACLSPSLWTNPEEIAKLLENAVLPEDMRIYMDYGSEELGNHPENPQVLQRTVEQLEKGGTQVLFRIVPGGQHCEASWEKQIPVFMEFLGF